MHALGILAERPWPGPAIIQFFTVDTVSYVLYIARTDIDVLRTHKFLSTQCIFNGRLAACTTQFKAQIREKVLHFTEILDLLNIIEMKSRRTFFSDVFVYIIISMHTALPLFRLLHCKIELHFWGLEPNLYIQLQLFYKPHLRT